MTIFKKLRTWGAIGLIALASCTNIEKSPEVPLFERVGNHLIGYLNLEKPIFGYDTDKDGIEDTRLYYQLIGTDSTKRFHFQLYGISEDKNRNGKFEEDEFKLIEVKEEYNENNDLKRIEVAQFPFESIILK